MWLKLKCCENWILLSFYSAGNTLNGQPWSFSIFKTIKECYLWLGLPIARGRALRSYYEALWVKNSSSWSFMAKLSSCFGCESELENMKWYLDQMNLRVEWIPDLICFVTALVSRILHQISCVRKLFESCPLHLRIHHAAPIIFHVKI